MGVIAKLSEEQIAEELDRAEAVLERLRTRNAPWESVSLAESKVRSLRKMRPARREWVVAQVILRQTASVRMPTETPVPVSLRRT